MATPTFRGAGTWVFGPNNSGTTGNLTPTKNASTVNGDLMVLITEATKIDATCATPSGWNPVSGFPKSSATTSGGRIYVFTRIADGSGNDAPTVAWSALTSGTTGTLIGAGILSYQNALEALDGGTIQVSDLSAQGASSTVPAFTTLTANSLVLEIGMKLLESSGQTSTVTTFTERADSQSTNATGHIIQVGEKVQAAAGSTGTGTITWSATTSARALIVVLGFKAAPTSVTLTSASETDAAQALGVVKPIRKALTAAPESSSAVALAVAKPIRKTATVAAETDTAQVISFTQGGGAHNITLVPVAETDSARTLAVIKPIIKALAAASEIDVAVALASVKPIRKSLLAAAEGGAAVALSISQPRRITLVPGAEADSAVALVFTKPINKNVTAANEADLGLVLVHRKALSLTPALETSLAQVLSVTHPIRVALVPADETDIALALAGGPVTRPSERWLQTTDGRWPLAAITAWAASNDGRWPPSPEGNW